jgi:hypothetical protein
MRAETWQDEHAMLNDLLKRYGDRLKMEDEEVEALLDVISTEVQANKIVLVSKSMSKGKRC